MTGMGKGRWILIVTSVLVAVLAVVLSVMQWQEANKMATSIGALAAVAAVGVAIWAALLKSGARSIQVNDSGRATARGSGKATTGIRVPKKGGSGNMKVKRSGDAQAEDDGDASTGITFN
jgi:hypothetical protein